MKVILKARGGASYEYDLDKIYEKVDTILWDSKSFLRQFTPVPTYLPIFNETWSAAIPADGPQPTLIEPLPTAPDP